MSEYDDEILKAIKEFPPDHPYRIHFLEHIDWIGKRVIRLDPACKYCERYKRHDQYTNGGNQ